MTTDQPPSSIIHTLNEPWCSHLRAALQEIDSCRAEELRLRGLILEVQERSNRRRANLQELVMLLIRDAGLPTEPAYTISSDGTTLTADLVTTT